MVKNVTGYDLPKLACGSWGRLVALTQVTLKVMPRGRTEATLAWRGLADDLAQAAMTLALRAPAEVACAAHLPAAANDGEALTVLKLMGFEPSVRARSARVGGLLADFGRMETLAAADAKAVWRAVREVSPFRDAEVLWRLSVPPSKGADVGARLASHGGRWLIDWGGGLVWLAFDGDATLVREVATAAGGPRRPGARATVAARCHAGAPSREPWRDRPFGAGAPRLRPARRVRDRTLPGPTPCALTSRPNSSPIRPWRLPRR